MIAFKDLKLILVFWISITTFCIIGCKTVDTVPNAVWDCPIKPTEYPVEFVQKDNGLYINEESSINLLKNINGMDAYIEKLEALITEMKLYYGAK